jgi:hypothetical protein
LSYGKMVAMARKRQRKKFSKIEAVKALARERVGSPPASQVILDRTKRKKDKHKATLSRLLNET